MKNLAVELARLQSDHLYRERQSIAGPQSPHVKIGGRDLLSFCSNDYMGLANHPEVISAFKRGATNWGVGSGASHLISGHTRAHHELEQALAAFTHRPRALLFSTGYMANMSIISALCGRNDFVFQDRLNHASLLDGGLLSHANFRRYPHTDISALDEKLSKCGQGEKLIASDGVFSMDGDIVPLPELSHIAKTHHAWLLVDDAHGLGVLGKNGGGVAEHFNLDHKDIPILVGTLGKAFGTFGAFVAGSEELIEFLINKARPYIYTTALPAAIAEATRTSLKLIQTESWRREHLNSLIKHFRDGAKQIGVSLMDSITAIQPWIIGDTYKTIQTSQSLLEKNILVTAIRPPTVPKGTARLRFTFSAAHSETDINRLLDALDSIV